MTRRVISLFSGCGGMDIGFEGSFSCLKKSINTAMHPDWIEEDYGDWALLSPTGFDTIFANDIRSDAKCAWTTYFSNKRGRDISDMYRLGSIVDLVKRARAGEDIFPEGVDVVTGGFPCQDFSIAGKRQGFDSRRSHDGGVLEAGEPSIESRGQLYMWMRDVISITKPKLFVAENVKGLMDLADVKEVIERDFADACNGGYVVVPAQVLYAADYGVPQSRARVIFFGFKKSALKKRALKALTGDVIPPRYNPYPDKTHGIEGMPYVTCADAFIGLSEPEMTEDPSQRYYSKAKFMGTHCQGQTEVRLDSVGPTIRSEHHGNIEFRRLSPEHGGGHCAEIAAGLCERRLTVRECARIQSFPDDYELVIQSGRRYAVSPSCGYKLVGNAVPPLLAYHIAKRIEQNWDYYFRSEK
ncbi:MAG: DNA (cytosine-5-)-methyltransferase [Alistipes sp.]|nr:DNA (cytosine-5-)-methyltransferase [Alistipes sp.]